MKEVPEDLADQIIDLFQEKTGLDFAQKNITRMEINYNDDKSQKLVGKFIMISEEELNKLKKDSEFLARLHAAGVDNWEWYSEACEDDD